jgi:hypothetical protein
MATLSKRHTYKTGGASYSMPGIKASVYVGPKMFSGPAPETIEFGADNLATADSGAEAKAAEKAAKVKEREDKKAATAQERLDKKAAKQAERDQAKADRETAKATKQAEREAAKATKTAADAAAKANAAPAGDGTVQPSV